MLIFQLNQVSKTDGWQRQSSLSKFPRRLQQNQDCVVGGVTNINVPGDTDSTATQITAKWNFQSGGISQNLIGKYAVKVSSPAGHFTLPITNFFTVTNASYKQSFTGNNSNLRFSRSFPDEAIRPFTAQLTNVAILVGILLRIFSISSKISVQ